MTDRKPIALEDRDEADGRLYSPSAARNRDAILSAFRTMMPEAGIIIEIGSGTGEHAAHIAGALPGLSWRPGDPDPASRASIAAWASHLGLSNIAAPHDIDVAAEGWETAFARETIAGLVSMNMIHIAPFEAAKGLLAGAGRLLRPGGKLFLYGPFSRNSVHTAPSNAAFDESLRARDPRWGVRDLERDIVPLAEKVGFGLAGVIDMPANNLSVSFLKN